MICPACRKDMIIIEVDKVEIDYCPICEGTWLDEGELELLMNTPGSENSPIIRALASENPAKTKDRRPCPACDRKMWRVDLPTTPAIEIDRCPAMHGLWFDKGELQDVLKASGSDDGLAKTLKSIFG